MNKLGRPVEILLVDDNFADIDLMKEGLRTTNVRYNLQLAMDGVEALAMLRQQDGHEKASRPDLIVLDMGLPKKDGRAVLAEVKSDPTLKRIPVIILTSSRSEDDIDKCYELHANCYVTKSIELDKFMAALKSIENFWLTTAELPS
jgi:chemotaxis family two-component system response regulator Rcp1